MTMGVRSWEEKEGEGGCKNQIRHHCHHATIGTREDLTRVMDSECWISSMIVVVATRHLAREVGEGDFANDLQQRATNVALADCI